MSLFTRCPAFVPPNKDIPGIPTGDAVRNMILSCTRRRSRQRAMAKHQRHRLARTVLYCLFSRDSTMNGEPGYPICFVRDCRSLRESSMYGELIIDLTIGVVMARIWISTWNTDDDKECFSFTTISGMELQITYHRQLVSVQITKGGLDHSLGK
ncbi:hypothetical protein PCH_Pc22g08400 [Penicillium rubens Wisconsin 54-1255]|uniref:Uncharacterized protein n=1 Tax=Penicillium rubens (strain ATCC 28089 / DSM 1075 / NRRL 1951 / Wisconsin 54-1255) TaxID=500485 RepID=B6HSA5_PENRW|nr:hypothetical protein PCH_Pc22g08400 [Penicillium rubens Wisconsin 54-1255]